jgi:hypothetical protein
VGSRAGLDDVEKTKFLTLQLLELQSLGRLARRQSLHRLRYPSSSLEESSVSFLDSPFVKRTYLRREGAANGRWNCSALAILLQAEGHSAEIQ